jgi:cytochrome c-type biogenesis protein CcmH
MNPSLRLPFMAFCAIALLACAWSSFAFSQDAILTDPQLEARARGIFRETRCLVCVGESLAESEADLAKDMRHLIRQRLMAGQTDQQIRDYLESRYGESIALRPAMGPNTYLLWGLPFVMLVGGIGLLFVIRQEAIETSRTLTRRPKRRKPSARKKR